MSNKSDSAVQRELEAVVLEQWKQVEGVRYCTSANPDLLQHVRDGGARVRFEVDAVLHPVSDETEPPDVVLVEVYTSLGKPRGGQAQKLKADALKLIAAEKLLSKSGHRKVRKVILVTSEEAEQWLTSPRTWVGLALESLGIEVHRVELSHRDAERLRQARARQAAGIKG